METARILVDGQWIGDYQATSGHLYEGSHRLTVMVDEQCYYEGEVTIGRAEKKNVELTASDLYPRMSGHQGKIPVMMACGIIYLASGDERLAYQKLLSEPVLHQKRLPK